LTRLLRDRKKLATKQVSAEGCRVMLVTVC